MTTAKPAASWQQPGDCLPTSSMPLPPHHEPDRFGSEMGNLVHVSECLSHALDLGELPSNQVPELSDFACASLGVSWPKFAAHFAEIEAQH